MNKDVYIISSLICPCHIVMILSNSQIYMQIKNFRQLPEVGEVTARGPVLAEVDDIVVVVGFVVLLVVVVVVVISRVDDRNTQIRRWNVTDIVTVT